MAHGYEPVEWICEHGNELSGSIELGKFLGQLKSDRRLLKRA
jgi:hypothetical protein